MSEAAPSGNLPDAIQALHHNVSDIVRNAGIAIATKAQLFSPSRTDDDFHQAVSGLYSFLAAQMAMVWMEYLSESTSRQGSERIASFNDRERIVPELYAYILDGDLLPEYRAGYLAALLSACHLTREIKPQRRLWDEFVLQLSNLLVSMCAYSEQGQQIVDKLRSRAT